MGEAGRTRLIEVIGNVHPVGEPFSDALYLVRVALADPDPATRERACAKIHKRLRTMSALLDVYQSAVVGRARELGHGALKFGEAAEAIGRDEFEHLRDVYLLQLSTL